MQHLIDPAKSAYNIRRGRIHQRNVEYMDEIGFAEAQPTAVIPSSSHKTAGNDQICKNRGRLSGLFNFAIRWNKPNEKLLINPGEILPARQLLKPCPPLITVRPRRFDYFVRT